MAKVSIIIPSRNESLLAKSIDDIFAKATGDIEVIVVLDGPTSFPLPLSRPNLTIINYPQPQGLRVGVNAAAAIACGKYLLKTDAHCMFGPGFDEVLAKECEDNWVVIPRRFSLNPETWSIIPGSQVDYHYYSCPWTDNNYWLRILPWISQGQKFSNIIVDDLLTFQGSIWFMTANHFRNRLHGLHSHGYGPFIAESHEISFQTWLGGGRVIINKRTWYAHLHQQFVTRGWPMSGNDLFRGLRYAALYWSTNQWPDRVHDFDWLIDKFWPLPTERSLVRGEKYVWPENWRDYYEGKIPNRRQ